MLRINLQLIFQLRGINNGYTFLKSFGYSSTFCSRLNNGKNSRLDLDLVEKLCKTLHCTPNDILEWTPEEDDNLDQPLSALNKKDHEDISAWMHQLSVEEMINLKKEKK